MKARLPVLVRWFYAALLRLYPPGFRVEYGHEMTLAFRERTQEVLARHGAWALVPLLMHITLDALQSAVRERVCDVTASTTVALRLNGAVALPRDPDQSTRALSLILVLLGTCLLVLGWYHWVMLITAHP